MFQVVDLADHVGLGIRQHLHFHLLKSVAEVVQDREAMIDEGVQGTAGMEYRVVSALPSFTEAQVRAAEGPDPASLQALTSQQLTRPLEWRRWWNENKKAPRWVPGR